MLTVLVRAIERRGRRLGSTCDGADRVRASEIENSNGIDDEKEIANGDDDAAWWTTIRVGIGIVIAIGTSVGQTRVDQRLIVVWKGRHGSNCEE